MEFLYYIIGLLLISGLMALLYYVKTWGSPYDQSLLLFYQIICALFGAVLAAVYTVLFVLIAIVSPFAGAAKKRSQSNARSDPPAPDAAMAEKGSQSNARSDPLAPDTVMTEKREPVK